MNFRHSILCFLLLTGIVPVSLADNSPVLVIIGASYAADWKQPKLGGYTIVNRGKGGEETFNMLARFDRDVVAAKPDAVLIWGHINNIHRASGKYAAAQERIKSDYREMVAKARAAGIEPILATEVTLSEAVGLKNRLAAFVGKLRGKTGYAARINSPVRAVNDWLREYARTEKIRLLDIEKLMDDGEGYRDTDYTSDDGTHISDEGYTALTAFAQTRLVVPRPVLPGRETGKTHSRE
jgi:lysophospholipase L1-like esterase